MLSAGAAIKDQGLAGTQNMYINPLFPPLCVRAREGVCEQNSSELLPLLEWTGFVGASRVVSFITYSSSPSLLFSSSPPRFALLSDTSIPYHYHTHTWVVTLVLCLERSIHIFCILTWLDTRPNVIHYGFCTWVRNVSYSTVFGLFSFLHYYFIILLYNSRYFF